MSKSYINKKPINTPAETVATKQVNILLDQKRQAEECSKQILDYYRRHGRK